MKRLLFSICTALAILGCGGDMDDNMPCLTCKDAFHSSGSLSESSSSSGEEMPGPYSSSDGLSDPSSSSGEDSGEEPGPASSSSSSSSIASTIDGDGGPCRLNGQIVYCQYTTGCYELNSLYSDGANCTHPNCTCYQVIASCLEDGSLYTGVTGLNESNGWGQDVDCAANGGRPNTIPLPPSSSSIYIPSSSSSAPPSSSSLVSSSSSSLWISSSTPSSSSLAPRYSSSAPSSSSIPNVVYGTPVTYGGETYQTVVIGNQTWFARNLNYNANGSKCYGDDPANCGTYGRLYDWATAMTVCPSGWHLPSQEEWNTLSSYVQSSSGCSGCDARLLKSTNGWYNNGNGTDAYGFSALPGGGYLGGSFDGVGYSGIWWSSNEGSATNAYRRDMVHSIEYAYWFGDDKGYLYSVRCVKDNDPLSEP